MSDPLRIAIAGLGTVGGATFDLLQQNEALIALRAGRRLEVVAVSAQSKEKHMDKLVNNVEWVDDPCAMAARADVDAVAVLIGGENGIALEAARAALSAGKAVVTANKALLAAHGVELAQLAEQHDVALMMEASIGGGIPIIKVMREALAGNKIAAIKGILNGTCNYILTQMAQNGLSFAEALREAQAKGYAEADPSTDIDGHDTAHKLALLCAFGFGVPPSLAGCSIEGLRSLDPMDLHFANDLGYAIKLLGSARQTEEGIEAWVGPCLVPHASILAKTDGVLNAISVDGDAVGPLTLVGQGAGGAATASAVVADLVDLARGVWARPFGVGTEQLGTLVSVPDHKRYQSWYVRMQVIDQPGVIAAIAAILRDEGISIDSIIQRGASDAQSVPLILKTHRTNERAMWQAIEKIAALCVIKEPPLALRIEEI